METAGAPSFAQVAKGGQQTNTAVGFCPSRAAIPKRNLAPALIHAHRSRVVQTIETAETNSTAATERRHKLAQRVSAGNPKQNRASPLQRTARTPASQRRKNYSKHGDLQGKYEKNGRLLVLRVRTCGTSRLSSYFVTTSIFMICESRTGDKPDVSAAPSALATLESLIDEKSRRKIVCDYPTRGPANYLRVSRLRLLLVR